MKALTIRQPWASLIAEGVKTIETRSWATRYRGPIAIHAGARSAGLNEAWPAWQATGLDSWSIEVTRYPGRDNGTASPLPLGAVVATAVLTHCVPTEDMWRCDVDQYAQDDEDAEHLRLAGYGYDSTADSWWVAADQLPFGDFAPGRYAWLLEDVTPIAPRPAKGKQGLWNWDPWTLTELEVVR